MKLGQTSYIGALNGRAEQERYAAFYAHLHRVVDEKIGRLLRALGDAADPGSLRSRTVIARTSDHGEMALSHGALRQKMFNAYEESIRVPLVISNPQMFPEPQESDALASLVDIVPTLLGLSGSPAGSEQLDGHDLGPVLARRAGGGARRGPVHLRRPPGRHGLPGGARASPTGSAACATGAGSTRCTWTRRAASPPSTSSTTSRTIPTRR